MKFSMIIIFVGFAMFKLGCFEPESTHSGYSSGGINNANREANTRRDAKIAKCQQYLARALMKVVFCCQHRNLDWGSSTINPASDFCHDKRYIEDGPVSDLVFPIAMKEQQHVLDITCRSIKEDYCPLSLR